ncbi:dihydrodipicolinate synthase family protein [Paracoccus sp. (in: a-proteobacteria)]|uniref:dihydrodipicolinate synthase family protein n=1 Tax=Paracoccus sp. TaxID=267 RepID=UPI003A8895FA
MTDALAGILPVLPTPFTAAGSVDFAAMAGLVEFARDARVSGVVFPGFASEVEHLTGEERRAALAEVVRAVDNAFPVVAGASAGTAAEVITHGWEARDLGLRWLMIQPPKSVGAGAGEVIAFFAEITASLPDTRIVLQNAPAPRGSDLLPGTILEIVRAVPQIAYVKEETLPAGPAISAILAGRPAHLLGVIGGGGARYILDEYRRGACAAMPAVEIAAEHVAMDRAWRGGDPARARDLYVRTLPLLTLQAVYRMRLTKHVMMRRGVLANADVRAPTPPMDAIAIADIDANLAELGIPDSG